MCSSCIVLSLYATYSCSFYDVVGGSPLQADAFGIFCYTSPAGGSEWCVFMNTCSVRMNHIVPFENVLLIRRINLQLIFSIETICRIRHARGYPENFAADGTPLKTVQSIAVAVST